MYKLADLPNAFAPDAVMLLDAASITEVRQLASMTPDSLVKILNKVINKQRDQLIENLSEINGISKALPTDMTLFAHEVIDSAKRIEARKSAM